MSAPRLLPQAVFRRAREPRELPPELRLRALEWALYFAVDGEQTVAELGRRFRADDGDRDGAFARLESAGLVREQELGAAEYVRALAAAGGDDERTLHEFLSGAVQAPVAVAPAAPAAVTPAAAAPIRPIARPAFGFKPLPLQPSVPKESRPMTTPPSRKLSLRALMDAIEHRAGSREAGQLDVYRVFVRIDTALLRRNGIETLRFTDDRLIGDPELEQALVHSVRKTLGVDCPESAWVEVA